MQNLKGPPLVSVVILNYNGRQLLQTCLESVLMTNYPNLEVIFGDNGWRDRSGKCVQELFGRDTQLRILPLNQILGFAGGNNEGARLTNGEYVTRAHGHHN